MKNFSPFLLLLLCFSCSKTPNATIINALKTNYLSDQPLFDYEDSTAYKIISLETTEKSLLGSIDKIMLTDSVIVVLADDNSAITIFNLEGKFRSNIDSKGRGPMEYSSLGEMTIYNDTIFLLDYGQQKIQKFNYDGKYIGTDQFKSYRGMEFEKVDNGYLFYIHSPQIDEQNSEVIYTDNLGNIKAAGIPRKSENIESISNANYFSKTSDAVYFTPIMDDKIYRWRGNELKQIYDMRIKDLMGSEDDKYGYVYDLKVCDNSTAVISTTFNNNPVDIVLDIDNNKARLMTNITIRGTYKNYFITPLLESDLPIIPDQIIATMISSNENTPIVLIDTEKIIW